MQDFAPPSLFFTSNNQNKFCDREPLLTNTQLPKRPRFFFFFIKQELMYCRLSVSSTNYPHHTTSAFAKPRLFVTEHHMMTGRTSSQLSGTESHLSDLTWKLWSYCHLWPAQKHGFKTMKPHWNACWRLSYRSMVGFTGVSGWQNVRPNLRMAIGECLACRRNTRKQEVFIRAQDADFYFEVEVRACGLAVGVTPDTLIPLGSKSTSLRKLYSIMDNRSVETYLIMICWISVDF